MREAMCKHCGEEVTPVAAHYDLKWDDVFYVCPVCGKDDFEDVPDEEIEAANVHPLFEGIFAGFIKTQKEVHRV